MLPWRPHFKALLHSRDWEAEPEYRVPTNAPTCPITSKAQLSIVTLHSVLYADIDISVISRYWLIILANQYIDQALLILFWAQLLPEKNGGWRTYTGGRQQGLVKILWLNF